MTPRPKGPEKRRAGKAPGPAGTEERPRFWGWGPANLVLLGLAVVTIVVGYVLLDRGSITAAPVLLVLGYAVLLPAGILIGSGRRDREEDPSPPPTKAA